MIIIISIFIRAVVVKAVWTILFDKFKEAQFPNSDADLWEFKTDCSGITVCGIGTEICNRNPNKLIVIGNGCNSFERTFTNLIPHYQVRVYFDAYFLSASDTQSQDFKFFLDTVLYESRTYMQSDLPYNIDCCSIDYGVGFDVKSYRTEIAHTNSNLNIQFCSTVAYGSGIKRILGLRNIQILLNTCHPTCKGCSGEGSNLCTSCYFGSPSAGGECPVCLDSNIFIDVTTTICQQECSREKLADENNICQENSKLSIIATEFDTSTISTYNDWKMIPDPIFYFINNGPRIQTCSSVNYLGPFEKNEGIYRSITLAQTVQFIRIRATFVLSNWQQAASIHILFNEVPNIMIQYDSGLIKPTNCVIILDTTSTCGQVIRVEIIIETTRSNSILKLKGDLKKDTGESWGLRDIQIDQQVCENNCDICSTSNSCSICKLGYVLWKGKCITSCPIHSIQIGFDCQDYDEETPTSKYEIKAFYDTSIQYDEINNIIGTYSAAPSDYNQRTGQLYGYLADKRVFGGALTWHKASTSKSLLLSKPHYAYRYRMEAILGEGKGVFAYQFSGDSTIYYIFGITTPSSSSNIWGKSYIENMHEINNQINHNSGQIDIEIQYFCSDNSEENGFGALANYFLVVHYCAPFCTACTGPLYSDCTAWETQTDFTIASFTPLQCQPHRYLDKTVSPYTCPLCSAGCDSCTSSEACTQCYASYYLESGKCYCYPEFYQSGTSCTPCNNMCHSCYGPNINNCLSCNENQYRTLDKNDCVCKPNYEENSDSLICKPICGDMIVVDGEDCDDGNDSRYDGCFKCKYECALNCKTCIRGVCYDCYEGYILQQQTKICLPFCGDLIIVGKEQCDDGNSILYDGCYECTSSCQTECIECVNGKCLQPVHQPFCGDGIVGYNEECDDGNLYPFDGCFNCQYSCSEFCRVCVHETCLSCLVGFNLNMLTNSCESICGDSIIVGSEQCDDGNTIPYDGCYNCQWSCQPQCSICLNGHCLQCETPGWRFDAVTSKCIVLSTDGYIVTQYEQCDDLNQVPFDGCFMNEISCSLGCQLCRNNECLLCQQYWQFDNGNNQCYPICGDGIIVGDEECENQIHHPMICSNCKLRCPTNCLKCLNKQCLQCQEGYQKSLIDPSTQSYGCISICGDQIIQFNEQCDDGNLQPFDGCFQCLISAQEECLNNQNDYCVGCQNNYLLDDINGQCAPVCGDGLIQNNEQCDDGILGLESCNQCNYEIILNCSVQHYGICSQCNQEFELLNNQCLPICQDAFSIGDKQLINHSYFLSFYNHNNCQNINNQICFNSQLGCQYQCIDHCIDCNFNQCLQCDELQGYYLIDNSCQSYCGDQIQAVDEECDDGNSNSQDGCFECKFTCSQFCLICSKGICIKCENGFHLNILNQCINDQANIDIFCEQNIKYDDYCNICVDHSFIYQEYCQNYSQNQVQPQQLPNGQLETTCGDGIIQIYEQCDDQNYDPFDGCFGCFYSCGLQCTSCVYGKCYECDSYWYIDDITNVCLPICGDSIIVGNEECDDGNLTQDDGCFECKLECEQPCTKCLIGICYECNALGWYFNANECETQCGDSIVAGGEQCDDGNNMQYDGCYNCLLDCQQSCLTCHFGYCFLCDTGWKFNEYKCESVCGDMIVVEAEQCDDGNDLPNDGCINCMYSCDINCETCGNGVCIECHQGWQISDSGICSPICGDQIVLKDYEDCDDGNQIKFDGCFECHFSCHAACTECLDGICLACDTAGWTIGVDNKQCIPYCGDGIVIPPEQCDDQNAIPQDGCFDCQFQCHHQCHICNEGICHSCSMGWYPLNYQCATVCGDGIYISETEQCDDGNNNDRDGCSKECQKEDGYECSNSDNQPSICFYTQIPQIILTEISNNAYSSTISLKFNQHMMLQQDFYHITNYTEYIDAELNNQNLNDYVIEIAPIIPPSFQSADVEFTIKVTFKAEIIQPTFVIKLENNLQSAYGRQLEILISKLRITSPQILSEDSKEKAEQLQVFSQNIMISMIITAAISLLTGGTVIFQNMLDQLQFLSYIKYVNVEFPENLQIYFEAFDIVSLNPILEFFKINSLIDSINGYEEHYIEPQKKFADDGINAYFLDNFISLIFCICLAYFYYYVSQTGLLILNNYPLIKQAKFSKFLNKIIFAIKQQFNSFQQTFYYSGLIQLFIANYYDISFVSLLQITNLNFHNINFTINSISSIMILFVQAWLTYKLLTQASILIQKTSFYKQSSFQAIFDGVKDKTQEFWSLQLNTLLSIKKFVFMITIVAVQDSGALQAVIIAFQSSLYIVYLIIGKPISSQFEYLKALISESITIFNCLTFLIYAAQKEFDIPYSTQLIIGWIHITTFSSQLVSTFLIDFIQQTSILYFKMKQKATNRKQFEDQCGIRQS